MEDWIGGRFIFSENKISFAALDYARKIGLFYPGRVYRRTLSSGRLLLLGMTGYMFTARLRRWGVVITGAILVLLGAWTILRKAGVLPAL